VPAFRMAVFCELVARSVDDVQLALHVGTRRDILGSLFDFSKLPPFGVQQDRRSRSAIAQTVQGVVTEWSMINLEVRDRSPGHVKAREKGKRPQYWRELGKPMVMRPLAYTTLSKR